eukprot:gene12157-biopygen18457
MHPRKFKDGPVVCSRRWEWAPEALRCVQRAGGPAAATRSQLPPFGTDGRGKGGTTLHGPSPQTPGGGGPPHPPGDFRRDKH